MDGYGNGPEIPTAALTLEDSDMLQRMSDRGQRITITLQMEAEMVTQNAVGHNVVAEIVGSQYPDEVIIVSGHLDSWYAAHTHSNTHIYVHTCAVETRVYAHAIVTLYAASLM